MEARLVTLAELATTHPGASRVFLAHGLDFCCRGRRSLVEACEEKRLDPEAILRQIREAEPDDDEPPAAARSLADLVDLIERRYHHTFRAELPEIVALAEKVEGVHAEKASCPRGLADHLRSMKDSVLEHADKEERTIFPLIREGIGAATAASMHALEDEHAELGRRLERTRAMTASLTPPADACTTWRALYLRLGRLEADLMQHIHLENNVLFPRALSER